MSVCVHGNVTKIMKTKESSESSHKCNSSLCNLVCPVHLKCTLTAGLRGVVFCLGDTFFPPMFPVTVQVTGVSHRHVGGADPLIELI